MTTFELYTQGARVWIPHSEKVWEAAELREDYRPTETYVEVLTEANEVKKLIIENDRCLPPLRNPSILIGANDLTTLSYLHEPAVLYNLQVRFCEQRNIYTYCGIILVAINPYVELPIYGIDTIQAYRCHAIGELDPHLFAVAEEAYAKLEREQRDQSIIVSGESGAGKTVSAKYTMRYFAIVGGNATETHVEKKILASSPIMEALGNAKTTRNDNSSRFGKFIELQFDKQFRICGASMRTYLLEKSRVVFQSQGERNYHIFYQLCAARADLPELYLDDQQSFCYLNQGCSASIEGASDLEKFEEMIEALQMLGFSEEKKNGVFKILAAILHLGNIQFKETTIKIETQDVEGCFISKDDRHLQIASNLLEINSKELRKWLCTRKIASVREVFIKPMSLEDAKTARNALAKHIYAQVFSWIIMVLNYGLQSNNPRHKFIGVLDIYGFETFDTNSFEQFCINYANEKLQQQFNLHVFKLEQEEYLEEDIEWKMIDFYDNQPCIDLIEVKLGVLDLLDEECKMPKGTDGSWTEKLYDKCTKFSHFRKAKFGQSAFTIQHFADKVQYESYGFLEKNRDTVYEEQINVMKQSNSNLVSKLFSPSDKSKITPSKPGKISQKNKKSVGSQFRDSLNLLMTTINNTTPYFIRCIKPNDSKTDFEYNMKRASEQLRACGVLETIRLSAAGFPSRWTYIEFFGRYRALSKFENIKKKNIKVICSNILHQCIRDPSMYQLGKTKIFFRASQVAYLEKLRSNKLTWCCITMQKTIRAFISRKKFLRIKKSAMLLQKHGRGYLGRRLATSIRNERAAMKIQKHIRGWLERLRFKRLKNCILLIQTYSRGYLARFKFISLKYNAKAVIIQKYWRGWLARKNVMQEKQSLIICQSAVRRFLARKQYKKLKIEARSIEHVKALNKGLENKIISLQQKIDESHKYNNILEKNNNNNARKIEELKNKVVNLKAMEIEVNTLNALLIKKNEQIDKMENILKKECDEKMDLIQERENILRERDTATKEHLELMHKINNMKDLSELNEKNMDVKIETRIKEEKQLILNEQDSDRHAYQKLLQEYHALEQHCEELERQKSHQRNISDISSISTLDIPEDHGYGSIRSISDNSANKEKLENINRNMEGSSASGSASFNSSNATLEINQKIDLGLVLKLQRKLSEVKKENKHFQKRIDELDNSSRVDEADALRNSFKICELEMNNSSLKCQLIELQEAISKSTVDLHILEQLKKSQDELERRSEEIVQLKTVLAGQTNRVSIVNSKTKTGEYINEDGELALAYETQKIINKQLELELQDEKVKFKTYEREFQSEIENLREDNERQQRILAINLTENLYSQNESYMRFEITRNEHQKRIYIIIIFSILVVSVIIIKIARNTHNMKQSELELQDGKVKLKTYEREFQSEIENLREDNERQQRILAINLTENRQNESHMRFEITRLTEENLELHDFNDALTENSRQKNRQIKYLIGRLKDVGIDLDNTVIEVEMALKNTNIEKPERNISTVKKQEREYQGMFSFETGEENNIMRNLVVQLKPRTAITLLPCLPAYIVFMCIRHTDIINDEEKVKCLISAFTNAVKKVIKKRHEDFETSALWFANTLRLLHTMKQYSGEKIFQQKNTPKQNEKCLRNFDLSEYRQVLSDIAVWINQGLVRNFIKSIQPLVVPAILEHEEIQGLSSNIPGGMRRRTSSVTTSSSDQKPTTTLEQEFTNIYKKLNFYGVDLEVVSQIFRQLFYFVCSTSLNNLLLRKDMCHWSKGVQIRHNLSHFEMWIKDKNQEELCSQVLQPIIQAAQLLQARKEEQDVVSICDMCSALSGQQICKILSLYAPVDEFEKRIPKSFVEKVQAELRSRARTEEPLLMETNFQFPVKFPFKPSDICLENIEIPQFLNLNMLEKV